MPEKEKLNIHQKILKIAEVAGVLQKTKEGFNYKYVPEEEIQAKVTACMQKYGVMLYPSLVPGTLTVEPYSYQKQKTKTIKDENGRNKVVDYIVPVNEVIVKAEVSYLWVNTDNPEDKIESHWAYIGQMEDASQAFGAGATYGNRYYLMKALQLATTEDDPDNYRSKQKQAEAYEETKAEEERREAIKSLKQKVTDLGSKLIGKGYSKDDVVAIVAKHNSGNGNLSSIKTTEVFETISDEMTKLLVAKKRTTKQENNEVEK